MQVYRYPYETLQFIPLMKGDKFSLNTFSWEMHVRATMITLDCIALLTAVEFRLVYFSDRLRFTQSGWN